jgi:hypothetical protein
MPIRKIETESCRRREAEEAEFNFGLDPSDNVLRIRALLKQLKPEPEESRHAKETPRTQGSAQAHT